MVSWLSFEANRLEHDDVIKQSEESETYSCLLRAPAGLFLSFCLLWHYPIFPMLNTDTPEDILSLLGTLWPRGVTVRLPDMPAVQTTGLPGYLFDRVRGQRCEIVRYVTSELFVGARLCK